jgi:hypothetical protein
MKRMTILIIVISLLILAPACVQGDFQPLTIRTDTPVSSQGDNDIELQPKGISPLEITLQPGGEVRASAPSSDQSGGNISSFGKLSGDKSANGEPGEIESLAPEGLTLEQEGNPPVNWLKYHDQAFSFTINYPETYTILPESAKSMGGDPAKVYQVRFLENQLAMGDTAEFEIPNFTIAVFELGNQSLETFVAKEEGGGERESFSIGNLTGFRVSFKQLIAPGEFYYFAGNGYVYKLTPLGPYSQEMLQSFQIE